MLEKHLCHILMTALEYDKFAGIYKIKGKEKDMEEQKELVGHVPVDLSSLIYHF